MHNWIIGRSPLTVVLYERSSSFFVPVSMLVLLRMPSNQPVGGALPSSTVAAGLLPGLPQTKKQLRQQRLRLEHSKNHGLYPC